MVLSWVFDGPCCMGRALSGFSLSLLVQSRARQLQYPVAKDFLRLILGQIN
jgi:hypothetical protein